jgi:folate-binding protein YgfZ
VIRKPCLLGDRAVIGVAGPEAEGFLQGLVTNDITALSPERPLYAALLSPQGKILFDFFLFAEDGTLLIDVHRDQRPSLIKRLTMYKLRAKVEIAARDDRIVVADDGPPDPRLTVMGRRGIVAAGTPTENGTDAYHDWRFAQGVPEAADFGSEQVFAMDGGLDELHAISFTKGCYVGQELTARMKHRGTDRKRLLPVQSSATDLAAGSPVTAGGIELGTLLSSYGDAGFALIRLDRLAEAQEPAAVAGHPISVHKPDWLSA